MRLMRMLRIIPMILCDAITVALSGWITILLHYHDKTLQHEAMRNFLWYLPILTVCVIVFFYFLSLYTGHWRYAGLREGISVILGALLLTGSYVLGTVFWLKEYRQEPEFYLLFGLVFMLITLCVRFSLRLSSYFRREMLTKKKISERIMIIGGGNAGHLVITEINASYQYRSSRIMCIIDDDPVKHGLHINGVKIVGGRDQIERLVREMKIDTIIFAIPSCPEPARKEFFELLQHMGCKVLTLPGLGELQNGVNIKHIREVSIEDLLGRAPIKLNLDEVCGYIKGRSVLVTGGGGSIGSELCRQLAVYGPKQLVVLDIYENTTYELQLELLKKFPKLKLYVHIGSVTDEQVLRELFDTYRPDVVFHAAAHKHVPLMEDSPREGVKNNVFGTLALARAADRAGVGRFVMISTDKAVNPTNVMGATKRMCEMIVQTYNKISQTEFVAVRFGNVLGSHGSVIPMFKKQIKEGGPVTVTHKDIKRYFMTIPEAVSLVLQAGALAKGGEIFVLDMGEPVKIVNLAENLIRLSGFQPYRDIDIEFTGLRPGEKLYEELLMDEEGLHSTSNSLIFIGRPIELDVSGFWDQLAALRAAVNDDAIDIRTEIGKIVTTYKPYQN